MPACLEARLKKAAVDKGLSGEKKDAYVYGTMNNIGAMRGNKETSKGKRMQKKHEAKMHKLSELA